VRALAILLLAAGCTTGPVADPRDYWYAGVHHDEWVEQAATCGTDEECDRARQALGLPVAQCERVAVYEVWCFWPGS
jgi:hypothetical protein